MFLKMLKKLKKHLKKYIEVMKKYKSLIFDCDGVILNSNKIKTEAFRKILQKYNQNAVDEFINYHKG